MPGDSYGERRPRSAGAGTTPKQRAIYCEALVPEEGSGNNKLAGPSIGSEIRSARESRPVSASLFSARRRPPSGPTVLVNKPPTRYTDVDPKVCEAHKTVPGRAPRRVRIERLRRQYEAQDISALLLQRGVDYSDPGFKKQSALPLEPFDDTEYDVRSPQEWLQLGIDPRQGLFRPLQAKAFWSNAEGQGFWRKALVNHYDEKADRFEVKWDEPLPEEFAPKEGAKANERATVKDELDVQMPRLRVLFAAEDPLVFADRVAAACATRRSAEIMIRYNFYIDNMPTEDVQQLNTDQCEWLKDAVKLQPGSDVQSSDVQAVLHEVQLDFARTMNRVTFDTHTLRCAPGDALFSVCEAALMSPVAKALLLPGQPGGRQPAPSHGLLSIPHHDFAETFASLCFATLRVRSEVVFALQGVKANCEKTVAKECVFFLDFKRPLRIDEYRQMYRAATGQASLDLKEVWTASLHQIVTREFENVGKGWFNIQDQSQDLYRQGKLRRFLVLVRLIMQDTLCRIARDSVSALVRTVERLAPVSTRVESVSGASCNYRAGTDAHLRVPPQAFLLEVRAEEASTGHSGGFIFPTEPRRFIQATLDAYDAGLQVLNEVQPLDRLLIPNLSRLQSDAPSLIETVSAQEPWVTAARSRIEECLEATLSGPEDYLALFQDFEELLCRDPVSFVEEILHDVGDYRPSDEELCQAIYEELANEEKLLLTLPEVTDIGIFTIVCKDTRRILAAKHGTAAHLLVEHLVRRMRKQMEDTLSDFQSLLAELCRAPRTAEELIEMRHATEATPKRVNALRDQIAIDVELFDTVESFRYRLGYEDIRQRWKLAAAPKQAMQEVARKLRSLQHHEAEFVRDLRNQQEEFMGFLEEIDTTIELLSRQPDYWDVARLKTIGDAVDSVKERITKAGQQARGLNSREVLLGRHQTDYSRVDQSAATFEPYCILWVTVRFWHTRREQWQSGSLAEVNAEEMEQQVSEGVVQLARVCQTFEEVPCAEPVMKLAQDTFAELQEFLPRVPLVTSLRMEGMTERHWKEIWDVVGQQINSEMKDFNLRALCGEPYKLQDHTEFLQSVAARANKEFSIERRLRQMCSAWDGVFFDCGEQYASSGTQVLGGMDNVSVLLDEQLAATQVLQHSPFKGHLAPEIEDWAVKLRYMLEHLEEWRRCQINWQYLQPIFDSLDVTRQLPSESRRFKAVDSLWRSTMQSTKEDPRALVCLGQAGMLDRWVKGNYDLESARRSLEYYLESKREKCSRLYFLSNNELLEVLSQSKDPRRVQPFINRLFTGVNELIFKGKIVSSIISPEGEEVHLHHEVGTRDGSVETWLGQLELALFATVRSAIATAVASWSPSGPPTSDLVAQAVLCAHQVHFTLAVESALATPHKGENDGTKLRQLLQQLEQDLISSAANLASSKGLKGSERALVEALAILKVHHRDVVASLVAASVTERSAFEWVSQLRHSWEVSNNEPDLITGPSTPQGCIWIRRASSGLPYGHEYLGEVARIVVTPTTLRCQAALLDLQCLGRGGAVFGKSGCGKSSTVQDLAREVGRHCLSFDCTSGLDRLLASQMLKGAAGSGSWCCFDELKSASPEALGLLAHLLAQIFAARSTLVREGLWAHAAKAEFDFEGSPCFVRASFGFFATLRTAPSDLSPFGLLPPSLVGSLRPVAMGDPDPVSLAEVYFIAAGFEDPSGLARKVVIAFRWLEDNLGGSNLEGGFTSSSLSNPRAIIIVVLKLCQIRNELGAPVAFLSGGAARQVSKQQKAQDHQKAQEQQNELKKLEAKEEEQYQLMRTIRDFMQPGLLVGLHPFLEDILSDLFPAAGDRADRQRGPTVVSAGGRGAVEVSSLAAAACEALHLDPGKAFTMKVVHLHTAVQSGQGVMLVGPAGSGKTACQRVLQRVLKGQSATEVTLHTLSPAAAEGGHFLGRFDQAEWRDGALAAAARCAASDATGASHWLVMDGPVVPSWADGVCAALDKGRRLCLGSGEVIKLHSNTILLFESEDLQSASPASVSRCLVVYFESATVGIMPLISTWLHALPETLRKIRPRLQTVLQDLLQPCVAYVVSGTSGGKGKGNARPEAVWQALPVSEAGLCTSALGILQSLLLSFDDGSGSSADLARHIDQYVIMALVSSAGAVLFDSPRNKFGEMLLDLCGKCQVRLPSGISRSADRQLFEKGYSSKSGSWVDWRELAEPDGGGLFGPAGLPAPLFEDVLVPTSDSARVDVLMGLLVPFGRHAALVGPAGAGKTASLTRLFAEWASHSGGLGATAADGPGRRSLISAFSRVPLTGGSTASELQGALESKLDKRRRGIYGPNLSNSGVHVFFVDDLNMPRNSATGATSPPLELLRQWFGHGGWFRSREQAFCKVVDIAMMAALRPPVGQRQRMPQRLLRHYHCIALSEPSEESAGAILTTLFSRFAGHLGSASEAKDVKEFRLPEAFAQGCTAVLKAVRERLPVSPLRPHCFFQFSDLWRTAQGICFVHAPDASRKTLARIWVHEHLRVLGDRLANEDELAQLQDILEDVCGRRLGVTGSSVSAGVLKPFTHLGEVSVADRAEEVKDRVKLEAWLQDKVSQVCEGFTPVTLFPLAIEHIVRICRTLRLPGGHCLLLGAPGSGRQTLARLSASLLGFGCTQPAVTNSYSVADWRGELKPSLLQAAGSEGKPQVLLLGELQFFDETALQDTSRLLEGNEIPQLFQAAEDTEAVIQRCSSLCRELRLEPTNPNVFAVFQRRLRRRLHCVLVMNPNSQDFRKRLRELPAITSRCTIDWFQEWPEEALQAVAERLIPEALLETEAGDNPGASALGEQPMAEKEENKEQDVEPEGEGFPHMDFATRRAIMKALPAVHMAAGSVIKAAGRNGSCLPHRLRLQAAPPSSFLNLVRLFCGIFKRGTQEATAKRLVLEIGVRRLQEAKGHIESMQLTQKNKWPMMETMKAEVKVATAKLEAEKARADSTQRHVQKEEDAARKKEADCMEKEQEAEEDLKEGSTGLEGSLEALKRLQVAQIREVRAMTKPPPGVVLTMAAMCTVLDIPPVRKPGPVPGTTVEDFWAAAQGTLLKNPQKLLDDMLAFDKDQLSPETVKKIQPFLGREDFEPAQVRKSSVACEAFCVWVRALFKYHDLMKIVAPKQQQLKEVRQELERTRRSLMEAQNKMEEIQRRVEAVASEVTALHSKQDRFLQEVSANETRIGRVENLLANLGDQRADWAEKVGKLRGLSQLLPGDALFCALMCAHGGPLNQANRSAISERAVLCMQGGRLDFSQGSLSLAKILGSRAKLTDWHLAGLPQDPQVVENMLIMDSASTLLWPFMVDPHTQGVRFVKEMSRGAFGRDRQKENPMKIVRESDPGLLQVVTATLELGGWLLIEEVGSRLDVALLPLLERRTEETDDGECCVRLGGSLVTWNPSFRLLLATSSPTMDLLPELAVHVTPLNFSVTLKGIEEQMLSLVISYENPDLEKRKAEVIGLRATYFRELEGAENKVLQILNDSGAAIFDDEQMISSILTTRLTWTAAEERAADVKRIEVDLDSVSISFATLAHHVSSLVNVVLSLDRMSNFYQFSLEWVKMILRPALEETRRGQSQEEQLQNAGEHCARHLYRAIAPSLCEQHRIVFGLHLALAQMLSLGRAEECDVGFLLNFGSAALPSGSLTRMKTSVVLEAALATLPPSDVAIFLALIQLPAFTGLTTAFVSAESEWKAWRSESIRPDKQKLPGNWESRITPLQRLCLLAVLRPDGLPRAAAELVARELGCDRGQPPPVAGLDELLGQWPALAPVLFVLHEDCPDPVVELRQTAARFGIQRGLEAVALASNQGPRAKRVLEEAKAKGGWVLLIDCHLGLDFLQNELSKLQESLREENTDDNFRLFLSTRPVDTFPAGLTRGSLKISCMAPCGVRAALLANLRPRLSSTAAAGDKAEDQETRQQQHLCQRLDFGLCLLHAMCAERSRRFGAVAWGRAGHVFSQEGLSLARQTLCPGAWTRSSESSSMRSEALDSTIALHIGSSLDEPGEMQLLKLATEQYLLRKDESLAGAGHPLLCYTPGSSLEDVLRNVEALPEYAEPEVFGMHPCSDLPSDRRAAKQLLAALTLDGCNQSAGPGTEALPTFEQVDELRRRVHQPIDETTMMEVWPPSYAASLNNFLYQEVACLNLELRSIVADLLALVEVLAGRGMMTNEMDELAEHIAADRTPQAWLRHSLVLERPFASWWKEFEARASFIEDWVLTARPVDFWLGAFAFPRGFIAGLQQEYSRRSEVSLADVHIQHHVMLDLKLEETTEIPDDGCLVRGLFLEGCAWNKTESCLELVERAATSMMCPLPLVWFHPVHSQHPSSPRKHGRGGKGHLYAAPLYQAPCRGSAALVSTIELPSSEPPEVWMLAGVAVLLSAMTD